jgi:hypothetical protein
MTIEGRFRNRSEVMAAKEQPPYSYIAAVDASAGDVSFSGYHICELRCKTAGSVKVDTIESAGVTLLLADYDIISARITKVYQTGTDEALRSGAITVFGFPD